MPRDQRITWAQLKARWWRWRWVYAFRCPYCGKAPRITRHRAGVWSVACGANGSDHWACLEGASPWSAMIEWVKFQTRFRSGV